MKRPTPPAPKKPNKEQKSKDSSALDPMAGISKARERLAFVSKQWEILTRYQKFEKLVKYTILVGILVAVIPATTLQLQLYKFQKTLAEQSLQTCEQQIRNIKMFSSAPAVTQTPQTMDEELEVSETTTETETKSVPVDIENKESEAVNEEVALEEEAMNPDEMEKMVEDEEDEFFAAAPKETNPKSEIDVVASFFESLNEDHFEEACHLLSTAKCNPASQASLNTLKSFKPMGGFKNLKVWASTQDDDFRVPVACVEYEHEQDFGIGHISTVKQRNSYYVKDGVITAQVCELRHVDGYQYECPILSARDFCL